MRLGEKNHKYRGITIKQRKMVKRLIETGSQTQAVLDSYNVKSRKVASQIAMTTLKKPHVQKFYKELLHNAGLDDEGIAHTWNEALTYGKGVKANHRDWLQTLTTITKMKGWLDPKSTHLRVDIKDKIAPLDYDSLSKSSHSLHTLEGEIVG